MKRTGKKKLKMFQGIVRWFPVLSVVEGFADGGAVEADDGEVPANLF